CRGYGQCKALRSRRQFANAVGEVCEIVDKLLQGESSAEHALGIVGGQRHDQPVTAEFRDSILKFRQGLPQLHVRRLRGSAHWRVRPSFLWSRPQFAPSARQTEPTTGPATASMERAQA